MNKPIDQAKIEEAYSAMIEYEKLLYEAIETEYVARAYLNSLDGIVFKEEPPRKEVERQIRETALKTAEKEVRKYRHLKKIAEMEVLMIRDIIDHVRVHQL